ncbi:30S ribosomal protein S20 [bacterium endosymbiont of Pedicinus badii]|uniref:30S ribosomal protein S20 n=1 Tax=bacterium endosymbiont of Pedicinus badii TaxID=1719126 RepID=UPI0009BA0D04|nr:30S ribosomal protein S20 [bacterium endosymbiont of Pedicinus badii]OQM34272.1 30S ribosomal protein S20 [bacterium endosymbiont of Pedicinus badii]
MATKKSAKKRSIQSKKRRIFNFSRKSMMKTFIKKTLLAIKENNKELSQDFLKKTQKILDKLAKKRIIHKNKSSRYKSRIMKKINKKFSN